MDDLLRQLAQGQLKSGQLPRTIDVWDLEEGFDDLRRCAFGDQVEWGGCIVIEDNRLQLAHQVSGWDEGVNPNCKLEDHLLYVGFAHIHLPDPITGKPYLGFSERDFRGTLVDGDNLALVCNGPEVFALVRASDCTARQVPDAAEFASWEKLFDDLIERARGAMASDPQARERGSIALNRALWQANREMCRRLGFAFYRGLWGQPLLLAYRPLPGVTGV